MNFVQYNPLFFSVLLLGTLQGVLVITLRLFKKEKWDFALFLIPGALAAPLLLKISGYYIIKEQIYLCAGLSLWSLLKAAQIHKRKIYIASSAKSLSWLMKLIALNWIVILPYALYLMSRPAYHSLPRTIAGLGLAGLSLAYEILRPFLARGGSWKALNDVFHGGTVLFPAGLFLMISPQLMGTDWITAAGPLIYAFLAIRPWTTLLSGNRNVEAVRENISFAEETGEQELLPYTEYMPAEIDPLSDEYGYDEDSDHSGIFSLKKHHHNHRAGGEPGFGL